MNSFKRVLSLALALILAMGMLPMGGAVSAAASTQDGGINYNLADSNYPVGMTVSVESSVITITVNQVGTSGTAKLYRMAANQYASGDSVSGKSTDVAATGTLIGEYTCGATQQFHINRYLTDGSDNLFDKYYLIQDGTILCGPVYASQINSIRNKQPFDVTTKKGLTLEDSTTINEAKDMGASNTVINMDLSDLIIATEDKNGNIRDLSKRTDLIEFESNGKKYYFNSDYIRSQDGLISAYTKAGMNVSMVLISWAKTLTSDYPESLKYWNQTNRQTLAWNTANERGMEYWIATMEFLADRYSKSSNLGIVNKFIIGNEIDYTYDWYLLEPLQPDQYGSYKTTVVDFQVFMEEYARTLRLANLAIKKYNAGAQVAVSLTHNWALNSGEAYRSPASSVRWNSYRPKEIVDWLVKYEGARGNYDWGLAVHPYAVGTNSSNPLQADSTGLGGLYYAATGNPDTTPWITVSNLEVYQLYLQRDKNTYNGQVRNVALTEACVLSEKSTSANYATSVLQQAASIAMMYYRAANIPCIDQVAYFQLHDQTTTSYMVGLKTSNGVEKPAYNVWKYVDTDRSFTFANKYLKYISSTATSYEDLMDYIPSDFNWDTMWDEDNIIVQTVEAGDTNRSMSVNKTTFAAGDQILVTATGDVGDTIELFLATDDIKTADPLFNYPVVGSRNGVQFRSGKAYDLLAYGESSILRPNEACLKAGKYLLVLHRGDNDTRMTKEITITGDYNFGTTEHSLKTSKSTYTAGEPIIVSASGGGDSWVGLYPEDVVPGDQESTYWYWSNWPAAGTISGVPVILQATNQSATSPSTALAPGKYKIYLFQDGGYTVVKSVEITIEEAQIPALTGLTFKLENTTDGFANGVVTVTKEKTNELALNCVLYWADANGNKLEGFTGLGKFKLNSERTVYQMPTHIVIPAEAKKLLAYGSDGYSESATCVSVDLPANCGYDLSEKPLAEFQMISDIHVTTDAGAKGEVKYSNQHFTMMLEDVQKNSPNSIGIFINGDIANTGIEAEFNKVLNLWTKASLKGNIPELHLSIGNHDWMNGNPSGQFQKYVAAFNSSLTAPPTNVYYDEVVGGYHFIYLGGEQAGLHAWLSDAQLQWFDQRMAAITAEDPNKPVFVMLHQSFYNTVAGSLPGQGWDGVANETKLKAIMKKYGQIILFNGHSHWELNSESNMYAGDTDAPVALNTAAVGYLWTSYDVLGGEFMEGTHGYYIRVYKDRVVILGRDFENQLFLPSATYVIQRNTIDNVQDEYEVVLNKTALNLGATASGAALSYSSSDTNVLSITDDGTVIAKKPGTAKVTIVAQPTNTKVITQRTVTINVVEDESTYPVTFRNWNGQTISTTYYRLGEMPVAPTAPTKAEDKTYTYTFNGWDKPVVVCNGSATYTATFKAVYKDYTVTFKNWDGSTLSSKTYHYGDAVTVPTATRPADNQNTYTFAGWDKPVTNCVGNATYTAQYTSGARTYTVIFKNWDGTVLSSKTYSYGATVTAPTATRPADNQYTYSFAGWDKTVTTVTGDATYTATYKSTAKTYTVIFKNWDGTVLSSKTYSYGATVTAPTATRPADNQYTYSFAGWDKTVTTVTGDATYTATYKSTAKTYTVTFKNWDGTELSKKTYSYGATVTVPSNPTRANEGKYVYTFSGWDKAVTTVSGDATYTAQYTKAVADYQKVERLFGATRYLTATQAADMLKERLDVQKFQHIVVASGTDFADALSGSYLANQKNAPILLVRNNKTTMNDVKAYIKANLASGGTVYLLGGDKAIPKAMESGLDGFKVVRLSGATRYETNLAILKEAGYAGKDILVCTGKEFADGLSASAVNLPILLVKDSLSDSQKTFLKGISGKIYIIGGTAAINTRIETALKSYGTVERIDGATRYVTSINIAKKFFPKADTAVLALGTNFPDGLSAGPLAYALDAPLLLTAGGKEKPTVEYATKNGIKYGLVIGGTGLISDKVTNSIFGRATTTKVSVWSK